MSCLWHVWYAHYPSAIYGGNSTCFVIFSYYTNLILVITQEFAVNYSFCVCAIINLNSYFSSRESSHAKIYLLQILLPISTFQVKLVSLYRYQPRIHIVQLDQPGQPKASRLSALSSQSPSLVVASQSFKETQFVAVTAYQNDKVGNW